MAVEQISNAAKAILEADALLICTGAGMGVDSGLGTFRGERFSSRFSNFELRI